MNNSPIYLDSSRKKREIRMPYFWNNRMTAKIVWSKFCCMIIIWGSTIFIRLWKRSWKIVLWKTWSSKDTSNGMESDIWTGKSATPFGICIPLGYLNSSLFVTLYRFGIVVHNFYAYDFTAIGIFCYYHYMLNNISIINILLWNRPS